MGQSSSELAQPVQLQKSGPVDVPQPEVTEGGVVLHQNNTWPIMAAGCRVVMTANVVIKEDHI